MSQSAARASVLQSTANQLLDVNKLRRPRRGNDASGLPYWTAEEQRLRRELPIIWSDIVNSSCYRQPFLRFLGEDKLPAGEPREIVSVDSCCNSCNLDGFPESTFILPPTPDGPVAPRKHTRAWFALEAFKR